MWEKEWFQVKANNLHRYATMQKKYNLQKQSSKNMNTGKNIQIKISPISRHVKHRWDTRTQMNNQEQI